MKTDTPKTIYLKDYKPYPFEIEHLDLNFDIHDGHTLVTAKANYTGKSDTLFLYGEELELLSLKIDGTEIADYKKDERGLTIKNPPEKFTLEIKTKIYPEKNTRLEGLYNSGGTYCTQCEAEGFRRITYFPDRPDVLTTYTVRIEADKKYPVLLSNGNRIDGGEADENRHFTIWEDPFPKPCYLFALVAGNLTHIHDTFTCRSGRKVDLYIYVRPGDEKQCDHAMDSLKRSMKWDEEVYGLEYDLDIFNIVAVSDFNMGAMENKSLNIFNTALVLAHQDTATDADFIRVESVIAHEYFHNWSGNRVTCRDWFQLSLKEGLTVFRDQEFSADTHSRDVQRIDDVSHLRRFQFAEDASPLAHPIRPDNYIEINNFYTMTVYEKGAEVIRMLHTILGKENYRKGTDLYFERHDGQAVTCEDFIKALEDASGIDLTQFRLWYEQAGTPEITFKGEYNESAQSYKVTITQTTPDTPGQTNKQPMHMPIKLSLLSSRTCSGIYLETDDKIKMDSLDKPGNDEVVIHLTEEKQSVTFKNIPSKPTPSILRGFSAPVKLKTNQSNDELAFLMAHDTDGFNRWEAGQRYYLNTLQDMMDNNSEPSEQFFNTYEKLLDSDIDPALKARALSLPDIQRIGQEQQEVDPDKIHTARHNIQKLCKHTFKSKMEKIYKTNTQQGEFSIHADAIAQRALRNKMLFDLTATDGTGCAKRAKEHYQNANNMTDRIAALNAIITNKNNERDEVLNDFYARFKDYPLVIDKWFSVQASAIRDDFTDVLKSLRAHPDFNIKNPNRVRSLYSAFAMNNPVCFHDKSGAGYEFLKNAILQLNTINPQIGARLLTPLREWRRYTPDRQEKMKQALQEILEIKNIAPDIFEIASKSLKA